MKTLSSLNHLKEPELQPVLQKAEEMLEHWHISYAKEGAFKHLTSKNLCALWGQVEPKLVLCLTKRTTAVVMQAALLEAVRAEDAFLRKKIPPAVVKLLSEMAHCKHIASATAADKIGGAVVAVTESPAKLTVDEQGRVAESEAMVVLPPTEEEVKVDWAATESSAEVGRLKSELLCSLWMAQDLLTQPPVSVIGIIPAVPNKKTFVRVKVVLTRDVAAFELVLVPVVKGLEAVVQKTGGKSAAVSVEMFKQNGEAMMLHLLPMAVQTDTKERFMPPYWCVQHGPREVANMESDEVEVDAILSLLSKDSKKSEQRTSRNDTDKFTVPVMTNPRPLLRGTELVFPKAPEREKSKTTVSPTWLGEASKELKKEERNVREGRNTRIAR